MQDWMNDAVDPRLIAHEDRMAGKIATALDERQERRERLALEEWARQENARRNAPMNPWLKFAAWACAVYLIALVMFLYHITNAPFYGAYK